MTTRLTTEQMNKVEDVRVALLVAHDAACGNLIGCTADRARVAVADEHMAAANAAYQKGEPWMNIETDLTWAKHYATTAVR